MSTFLASLTTVLLRIAAPDGLDMETLLGSRGMRLLAERPARLPVELADQALLRMAEIDPAIGLRASDCWRPIDLGPLGFAWLASNTLRCALQRTARFARVLGERARFTLSEDMDGVRISSERGREYPPLAAIITDISFSTLLSMCRQLGSPDLDPLRVLLRRPRPADPAPYLQFYRSLVVFEAAEDAMVLSRADADAPRNVYHRDLAATFEAILIAQLAELDRNDIVARCKAAIIGALSDGSPETGQVAEQLCFSRRTLQRKLAERGVTFHGLVDETRRELALRLLDNPAESVTEIAFLTGFSTSSAFARAFSRWTGESPTHWRRHGGHAPAGAVAHH